MAAVVTSRAARPVDVLAVNAAEPCPPWCSRCCPGVVHESTRIVVDTADAEYSLWLAQWCADSELAVPGWGPVRLVLYVSHKIEVAEGGIDPDNGLPIGLTLCAGLSPAEARRLLDAQTALLGLLAAEGGDPR